LSRLLSQLAQAYTSISISHLLDLAAPLNNHVPEGDPSRFDQENIEAFIMNTAKRGELLVRIDHSEGSLTFVDDALSTKVPSTSNALQPSPGALVRTRLSTLSQCLFSSLEYISPPAPLQQQLRTVFETARAERKALQLRRSIVARRRELLAELTARKQSEERSHQAEQARRAQEEAQKKKKEDAVREAQARAKAEMDRRKLEESVKIVSSLKDKGVNVVSSSRKVFSNTLVLMIYCIEHRRNGHRQACAAPGRADGQGEARIE
jgi:translation initiation factor 3 subunit A